MNGTKHLIIIRIVMINTALAVKIYECPLTLYIGNFSNKTSICCGIKTTS